MDTTTQPLQKPVPAHQHRPVSTAHRPAAGPTHPPPLSRPATAMTVTQTTCSPDNPAQHLLFIGGGNMASAIIGGLIRQGHPATHITAIDPLPDTRQALHAQFGITTHADAPAASASLAAAGTVANIVVWAVKPQILRDVALATAPLLSHRTTLHLSVAAGIPSASLAAWLGTQHIVRAMPNTPALIGQGMTGLFARPVVDAASQARVEHIIRATGQYLWVDSEDKLDAVTALSGSGPAYVFLLLEAMTEAGTDMGLTAAQASELAIATFRGAAELAARTPDSPATLRQRVTSKGGTTHAAITHMQTQAVPQHFIAAMHAARLRAQELATEFGNPPTA